MNSPIDVSKVTDKIFSQARKYREANVIIDQSLRVSSEGGELHLYWSNQLPGAVDLFVLGFPMRGLSFVERQTKRDLLHALKEVGNAYVRYLNTTSLESRFNDIQALR